MQTPEPYPYIALDGYEVRLGGDDITTTLFARVREGIERSLPGIPVTLDPGPHPGGMPYSIRATTMVPSDHHMAAIRRHVDRLLVEHGGAAFAPPPAPV